MKFQELEVLDGVAYTYEMSSGERRVCLGYKGHFETLKKIRKHGYNPGEIVASQSHEIEVTLK